jgi:hypothetical protein
MINNNKEDFKQKSYCLSQSVSDGGALAMMCGRDEELRPNAIAR